jgi:DNA-binding cell septation regulator SpoVG
MKITKVKIKKLAPVNGLIGFCSFVVDGWFYVGNIAIYARREPIGQIRLVFPEKKVGEKTFKLFHPLSSTLYYELEQLIRSKFYNI